MPGWAISEAPEPKKTAKPSPWLSQGRVGVVDELEGPVHRGLEHVVEGLVRKLPKGGPGVKHSGHVDEAQEGAQLACCVDQPSGHGGRGDGTGDHVHVRPFVLALLGHPLEGAVGAGVEDQVDPLFGQNEGQLPPDAFGGSADDEAFSGKFGHGSSSMGFSFKHTLTHPRARCEAEKETRTRAL